MTGIETYLAIQGVILGVKLLADVGVRLSKRTENTTDDLIANAFKSAVSGISFFKRK